MASGRFAPHGVGSADLYESPSSAPTYRRDGIKGNGVRLHDFTRRRVAAMAEHCSRGLCADGVLWSARLPRMRSHDGQETHAPPPRADGAWVTVDTSMTSPDACHWCLEWVDKVLHL